MKIYTDNDYKCHTLPGDGLREVETDFFDGRCEAFIRGFRHVPEGESWQREDGDLVHGPMYAPFRSFDSLMGMQSMYDSLSPQLEDMESALMILTGGEDT